MLDSGADASLIWQRSPLVEKIVCAAPSNARSHSAGNIFKKNSSIL
jgi:hypothetical protein